MAEPTPHVDSPIDPEEEESFKHWERVCAAMPPMTQTEIEEVGAILRRISERQAQQNS